MLLALCEQALSQARVRARQDMPQAFELAGGAAAGFHALGQTALQGRAVSERERDFSLLLGELRDISRNKTQGAIVAYSDGAPVCILLSAHSRLKSVFSANPETASLIKYVSGFTSAGALNELGKLISASAKIQSIDNLTPGVWRFPAPELSLDWLKKKPQGLRLRILSTKEQLRRSASALSRMHSTLNQTGGELEVIPVGPSDQD
jgi:hypothetical protein